MIYAYIYKDLQSFFFCSFVVATSLDKAEEMLEKFSGLQRHCLRSRFTLIATLEIPKEKT